MTLSASKLRAIINLLADPLQAGAAANILANEASERGVLVADLIADTAPPVSAPPTAAEPDTAPAWREVEEDGAYTRRIDAQRIGLVADVVSETPKAWRVELPNGELAWLAKSQCEHHGEDPKGRAILIVPRWLDFQIGLRLTP
jgi:hypothetical protein